MASNLIFKEAAVLLRSRFALLVLELFSSIILSRYLGAELKGQYSAILVYPLLLVSLVDMGVKKSIVVHLENFPKEKQKIIASSFLLWSFSSTLGMLLCAYLYYLSGSFSLNPEVIWLAVFLIPFRLSNSYLMGVIIVKKGVGVSSNFEIFPFFAKFISIVIFALLLDYKLTGILIAHIVAAISSTLLLVSTLQGGIAISGRPSPSILINMLKLGSIHAVVLFLLNLNYKADVILVSQLSSTYQVGQYSVGVSIAELLWQVPSALEMLVFFRGVRSNDRNDFIENISKLARVNFWFSLILGSFLFTIAPLLIQVIFGKEFSESSSVLQILIPGIIMFTFVRILYSDVVARVRPLTLVFLLSIPLLINITFNLLLIPIYGAKGAAIASTLSYSLASISFVILYCRILNIPLSYFYKIRKDDFAFLRMN